MSDLMEIMRDIQTGARDVQDVAAEFRTRQFPATAVTHADAESVMRATVTDPDDDPPGAFAEVEAAYHQGVITIDQYAILAEAAAASTAAAPVPTEQPTEQPTETESEVAQ